MAELVRPPTAAEQARAGASGERHRVPPAVSARARGTAWFEHTAAVWCRDAAVPRCKPRLQLRVGGALLERHKLGRAEPPAYGTVLS